VTDSNPPSELDRASLDRIVGFDLRVREALDAFAREEPDLTLAIATLNRVISDAIASMNCPACRESVFHFTQSRLAGYVLDELRRKSPDADKFCDAHEPKVAA
jgi:hypothetical protein